MENIEEFHVQRIQQGILRMTENYYDSWNKANLYLIEDSNDDSIMIDFGTGIFDPVAFLKQKGYIKSNPTIGIATHIHYDHIGGHKFLEKIGLHEEDCKGLVTGDDMETFPFVAKSELLFSPPNFNDYKIEKRSLLSSIDELKNGDIITFGQERSLEIIHLPGHTPGSIGVLLAKEKILFTGDALFDNGPMIDHYPRQGSRKDFKASMEKIVDLVQCGKVRLNDTIFMALK